MAMDGRSSQDHYAVLGVPRDATTSEIRRAYRRLARRYHPDAHPADACAAGRFASASRAYEVLRDPARRARYDRELESQPPVRRLRARSPGLARRAVIELTPEEARLARVAPLTLTDGRGLTIQLPAGVRGGDRLRLAPAFPWAGELEVQIAVVRGGGWRSWVG